MDTIKNLLVSKRVWVLILTALAFVLKKYVNLGNVDALADQIIAATGAILILVTKVMDAKKGTATPALNAPTE